MDHLWQRTLEAQRAKFEFVSRTEGELELSLVVTADHEPQGIGFSLIYSHKPQRWWNCALRGQHGSNDEFHLREYLRLAEETGRICQAVPGIEKLFPENSEWLKQGWGLDDFWTIVLFQIAWARPPGTPLWAVSDQITKDGYHSVDGSVAASAPIGLRSRLRIPPFSASGHVIAFIQSGALSSAGGPPHQLSPGTKPSLEAPEVQTPPLTDGETSAPEDPKSQARHGEDFTWVSWFGQELRFKKGNQAEIVRVLWEEWEKGGRLDGRGLSQETIGEKIGSASTSFSVNDNLRGHPALNTMIRPTSKGAFALFRPDNSIGEE